MADLSTLDFVANVPLRALSEIRVGQPCEVKLLSTADGKYSGRVVSISAQSDPGSQTVPVRIQFEPNKSDPDPAPRIGAMGVANITVGHHREVFVVPTSALLRDDINDTYWIYTITPDSLAREIPVKVGVIADSVAEIAAPGLSDGQAAIIQGNYEVSDSMRVTVERMETR
jgi:multidrug efflux pump subunit AcrA (membrane-fusion protein)